MLLTRRGMPDRVILWWGLTWECRSTTAPSLQLNHLNIWPVTVTQVAVTPCSITHLCFPVVGDLYEEDKEYFFLMLLAHAFLLLQSFTFPINTERAIDGSVTSFIPKTGHCNKLMSEINKCISQAYSATFVTKECDYLDDVCARVKLLVVTFLLLSLLWFLHVYSTMLCHCFVIMWLCEYTF